MGCFDALAVHRRGVVRRDAEVGVLHGAMIVWGVIEFDDDAFVGAGVVGLVVGDGRIPVEGVDESLRWLDIDEVAAHGETRSFPWHGVSPVDADLVRAADLEVDQCAREGADACPRPDVEIFGRGECAEDACGGRGKRRLDSKDGRHGVSLPESMSQRQACGSYRTIARIFADRKGILCKAAEEAGRAVFVSR